MTALDLSSYATTIDTPEVAALKEKVREVAQKYAKQHNWCSVVKRALKEAGIESDPVTVSVNVTTALGMTFVVKTDPSTLIGKTEDEQKAVLAERIGQVTLSGAKGVTGSFKVLPEAIAEMAVQPQQELAAPDPAWLYINDSSRVRHLIVSGNRIDPTGRYTACGEYLYQDGQDWSNRAEDRNCARCERSQDQFSHDDEDDEYQD